MQEEYILHLRDTYGASASAIAKMMGVVYNTLYKWLSSNGIHVSFSRGRTMSPEQKQAWAAFAGYEAPEDPQAECAVEAQQSPKPEEPAPECVPEPAGKMHMERFSLTFSGVINPSAIANSLIHILGENATGTVEIRCELMV
jgi:transposase-like protein